VRVAGGAVAVDGLRVVHALVENVLLHLQYVVLPHEDLFVGLVEADVVHFDVSVVDAEFVDGLNLSEDVGHDVLHGVKRESALVMHKEVLETVAQFRALDGHQVLLLDLLLFGLPEPLGGGDLLHLDVLLANVLECVCALRILQHVRVSPEIDQELAKLFIAPKKLQKVIEAYILQCLILRLFIFFVKRRELLD